MLTTRNTNWNSKGIRSTDSHINNFLLVEKQNPFNERGSSCASFIIKWIIAKFITKVPREKQNRCWAWSISNDIHWHDCSIFQSILNKWLYFIIELLLHLLRALEMEPICKSRNFNIFDLIVNLHFYFTFKHVFYWIIVKLIMCFNIFLPSTLCTYNPHMMCT